MFYICFTYPSRDVAMIKSCNLAHTSLGTLFFLSLPTLSPNSYNYSDEFVYTLVVLTVRHAFRNKKEFSTKDRILDNRANRRCRCCDDKEIVISIIFTVLYS